LNKKAPLVSVITGYYNRKQNIKESIYSILSQTYDNIEYIVFDDCSTDGTRELLRTIDSPNFRLIEHPRNLGFTRGLINAISQSSGKYIAIHGAGDISNTARIEKQVHILEENIDFGIVGCYSERLNSFKNEIELHKPKKLSNHEVFFLHGEIMFKREIYDLVGGYDGFYKYNQCTSFVRKIGKISRIGIIEEVLYKQIIYNDGVSNNPKKQFSQKVYSNINKQIKSLSQGDVDEYEYIPGVNNRRAIVDSYFTSLLVFGYVSLDKKFDLILKKNHKFLHLLSSSFLNKNKFKYLHILFFPGCLIRATLKNLKALK
jgi:glycosyltransferase involved in cell wall biosynthesis